MVINTVQEILNDLNICIISKKPFSLLRYGDGGLKFMRAVLNKNKIGITSISEKEGLPEKNVNDILGTELIGFDILNQEELDKTMLTIDGTDNKGHLGANAILSVSLAASRLAANMSSKPYYAYLHELAHKKEATKFLMPCPMSNVLNGGKHAGGDLAIQEFMILPVGAKSFSQGLQMIAETYQSMKLIIKKEYGGSSTNVGDEGGFAPNIQTTREALDIIMSAIENSGYTPGLDFVLGLDAAASEFYDKESEIYFIDGRKISGTELVDYYIEIIDEYSSLKFNWCIF